MKIYSNLNANIANNNNFKSFEYETKLLGNTEADWANGILKKGNNFSAIKVC